MADGQVVFEVKLDSSGFGDAVSNIAKGVALGEIGADIGKKIGEAAVNAFQAVVNAGISFDSTMSNFAAVTGATAEDMARISEAAKMLGETTVYTATDAGNAFVEFAKAGWGVDESLNGIGAVMSMAAAEGMSLGTAVAIAADVVSMFGGSASDAASYIDAMAVASTASTTDITGMYSALKYVGPLAGTLGYSIGDVSTALGVMANNGIKASTAGTTLRSLLSRMADPTDEVAAAMKDLGLSLTDAEGNTKPFGELIGDMRTAFSGLSEDQQLYYASTLAAKTGMSGLLALVGASEEDFNAMAEAIEKSEGATDDMAKTMLDNLGGDLTLFESAAEGLALAFYEGFRDTLRESVQTGTSIVQTLTEGIKEGDFAGALSTVLEKDVPEIASKIGEMLGKAFLKIPDLLTDLSEVKGSLKTGLANAGKALAEGISKSIGDNVESFLPSVASKIVDGIATALLSLPEYAEAANNLLLGIKNVFSNMDTSEFGTEMVEIAKALVKVIADVVAVTPEILENAGEIVGSLIKALGEALAGGIEGLLSEESLEKMGEAFVNLTKALVAGIAAALPGAAEGFSAVGTALLDGLKNVLVGADGTEGIVGELAQSIVDGINDFFIINFPELDIKLPNWDEILKGAPEAFDKLKDAVSNVRREISSFFSQIWEDKITPIINSIVSAWNSVAEAVQGALDAVEDFFSGFLEELTLVNDNYTETTWGDLIQKLFPSANAEELPTEITESNATFAANVSADAQQALVEAFQNGKITYDQLVEMMFNGGGASGEEDSALNSTMLEKGAAAKAAFVAGFSGAGEGVTTGAEGTSGEEGSTDSLLALGLSLAQAVSEGIAQGSTDVNKQMKTVIEGAKASVTSLLPQFNTLGHQISSGIAKGIKAGSGEIASALIAAIKGALAAAKKTAGIASPSRLFAAEVGHWIPAGVAVGVEDNLVTLRKAVNSMVYDTMPDMSRFGRNVASSMGFMWQGNRLVQKAARQEFQVPQEINFNVPVQTPDEFAQTVQLFATYGLEADY